MPGSTYTRAPTHATHAVPHGRTTPSASGTLGRPPLEVGRSWPFGPRMRCSCSARPVTMPSREVVGLRSAHRTRRRCKGENSPHPYLSPMRPPPDASPRACTPQALLGPACWPSIGPPRGAEHSARPRSPRQPARPPRASAIRSKRSPALRCVTELRSLTWSARSRVRAGSGEAPIRRPQRRPRPSASPNTPRSSTSSRSSGP